MNKKITQLLKMKTGVFLLLSAAIMFTGVFFSACENENEKKNDACDIVSFTVDGTAWAISGTNITHVYPEGTSGARSPVIVVSAGATVNPASGVAQDFFTASGVTYTVTAEDGVTKKTYTAKASIAPTAEGYVNVEARRRYDSGDYAPYQRYKTRTVGLLPDYEPPTELPELSKYGGRKEQRSVATGFFYPEKRGDRWWIIDPEGHLYLNVGVNSIRMGESQRNQQALLQKFGTPENWIRQTIGMSQENYFNCAGSWSDYERIIDENRTAEHPFVYTVNWRFMEMYAKERADTLLQREPDGRYPQNTIFVFDPAFETFCDRYAQQNLTTTKDDPYLFGHFSDNELPMKSKTLDNYLSLPSNDPGYQAASQWMKNQGITKDQITDAYRKAFMAYVGDRYFSIVSNAIKKYDPNHLYLGSRFFESEKDNPIFMERAGEYLDIISINYYHLWTPDAAQMVNWVIWTGKPFIVTEFYTKGEDSGLPNQSGAGWIVRTQKDRGLFYQNYVLALLESKNCVGWHWFRYQDNDPTATGVDPSNVDGNKGIVDNYYEVWTPLMELMKELNSQVYHLVDYFDRK